MRRGDKPVDHDTGWAAREVTLTSRQGGALHLPCHWIEYSHAGKGKTAWSFFIVSTDDTPDLSDGDWTLLAFKDGRGTAHRYAISHAEIVSPLKMRLTRVM